MNLKTGELYEFGPFLLDPAKRILLRNNRLVPLQLKAFQILLILVRNSEQVVLKDDLMKEVWPDSFVEESNLAQNIYVLRKTLNPASDNPQYIVTIPGRGYSFTSKVRVLTPEEPGLAPADSRSSPDQQPTLRPGDAIPTNVHASRSKTLLAVAVLLLIGAAFLLRPAVPPPRVTRIRQITQIGTLVHNTRPLTDGPRIYFRAWQNNERALRAVSTAGGEVFSIENSIPSFDVDDIAADGSEFLEVNLADMAPLSHSSGPYGTLWRVPMPTGSPQPVGALRTSEAAWSPDGKTVAYAYASGLYCANADGSGAHRVAALPEDPFYLAWSPDGRRLRFTVANPARTGYDIGEVDLPSGVVRTFLSESPDASVPWVGGWTPDGRYFLYTAVTDGIRNVWAIREKKSLLRRVDTRPVQLTNGPFSFYIVTPGRDGKHAFAVGEQGRGQLLRYDAAGRQFIPYAQGLSADHIAYSPDGQWMAYIEFPQGVLVRSRVDGTDRRQLTFPPMRALSPQWSPDGSRIVFAASSQSGGLGKIYLVSAGGGEPQLVSPRSDDRQSYPSWTPGGKSILYSSSNPSASNLELRLLDVNSGDAASLPGTTGLRWAQISRDGKQIAAIRWATKELVLYDCASHALRTLATHADYPRWSSDGKYLYFNSPYFDEGGTAGGVYRWNASSGSIETVLHYPPFMLTGAFGVDYSITPDGSILLLRDMTTRDLYAIDLDLP